MSVPSLHKLVECAADRVSCLCALLPWGSNNPTLFICLCIRVWFITAKGDKNLTKRKGTWNKVQRKPDTSFQESSPVGVTQDALNYCRKDYNNTCEILPPMEAQQRLNRWPHLKPRSAHTYPATVLQIKLISFRKHKNGGVSVSLWGRSQISHLPKFPEQFCIFIYIYVCVCIYIYIYPNIFYILRI